jgi:ribulose-5-phosphate 4-epimerase/fuculose-1-phosphate aldolase
MKTLIVGGDFGDTPKSSAIVNKIAHYIQDCDILNGGSLSKIQNINLEPYDLVLWFPNMSNKIAKFYPQKRQGAVLICSKVIREGYDDTEAVSRIFKMKANAVVSIISDVKPFRFKLIDALGNAWIDTDSLDFLSLRIMDFYKFTNQSIRINSISVSKKKIDLSHLQEFVDINKMVADKSESMGGRYFGNCSTRCESMFPSTRLSGDQIVVSKRNVDKSGLTVSDLVLCSLSPSGDVEYVGYHKPSVDTPIQLTLYKMFPEINFMIHGHYHIKNNPVTKNYFPCGDMREYVELSNHIKKQETNDGIVNLKNHGFLIYATTLDKLRELIDGAEFLKREIGTLLL